MATPIAQLHPAMVSVTSAGTLGVHHYDHIKFHVPRSARLVKDIVWLAVLGMTLAVVAVVAGVVDVFVTADLVPLTMGAGLSSITFGILGLSDRMSGR